MRADLTDAPFADLTCSIRPPRARVRMVGDFDLSTRDHLADVLGCLRLRGCTTVEVDAQEVSFVDAGTLRALHVEAARLRDEGGALVVVAASPVFARIVTLAGHTDLFPTALGLTPDPVDDCRRALEGPRLSIRAPLVRQSGDRPHEAALDGGAT